MALLKTVFRHWRRPFSAVTPTSRWTSAPRRTAGPCACTTKNLSRSTGIDRDIGDVTLAELGTLVDEETVPPFSVFAERCRGRIDLMPDMKGCPQALREVFLGRVDTIMTQNGLIENALFIGGPALSRPFEGRSLLARRPSSAKSTEQLTKHGKPAPCSLRSAVERLRR